VSIDRFLNRTYDHSRYNCAHFVAEVWNEITGQDITESLAGFLLPPRERSAAFELRRKFIPLRRPETPCIALLQRSGFPPHVGLFINRRILHITESGVHFLPPAIIMFGFKTMRFYRCK
jgi:hypothetical protein